jgi:hypothetical protein
VAIAWLPKATVQAALCGLPYDAAVAAYGQGLTLVHGSAQPEPFLLLPD